MFFVSVVILATIVQRPPIVQGKNIVRGKKKRGLEKNIIKKACY